MKILHLFKKALGCPFSNPCYSYVSWRSNAYNATV